MPHSPLSRARLELEELETRCLLSTFTPAQIRHAYGFDQVKFDGVPADGRGETIALVDAYNTPNIVSDLHAFDRAFNLPDPPTFKVLNQNGGTARPGTDKDWVSETTLDVEWAHALAPRANIVLVEANSAALTDLIRAVDTAANQPGVVVVAMSWDSSEFAGETAFDKYFQAPVIPKGVTLVAASGDGGAGAGPSYPAVVPGVLAVGGTTLRLDARGNYSFETAWNDSTGGISAFEAEPAYQKKVQVSGQRSNPDVAFNANPDTGYYVYQTNPGSRRGGWYEDGGTSAGAPQWAALIALVDQGLAAAGHRPLDGATQTLPDIYQLPAADFHDITWGSNGYPAHAGYDLVTGRGSPVANKVIPDLVALGVRQTAPLGRVKRIATVPQTSPSAGEPLPAVG